MKAIIHRSPLYSVPNPELFLIVITKKAPPRSIYTLRPQWILFAGFAGGVAIDV